ncbi:hypothetical protein FISHEDRAFT_60851 [Fistulina hepatica ATCC 64428]|uniref:Uncharacterized protein n=1 Tax=Fistulina hepatica ATCC 64428 TaxID=1128425 RepID=A0A0D7A4N3_9AGAR|nr:hypothetical protein FISHEDRAFT_60851 [Fistulina hepatica ATCC 64428]
MFEARVRLSSNVPSLSEPRHWISRCRNVKRPCTGYHDVRGLPLRLMCGGPVHSERRAALIRREALRVAPSMSSSARLSTSCKPNFPALRGVHSTPGVLSFAVWRRRPTNMDTSLCLPPPYRANELYGAGSLREHSLCHHCHCVPVYLRPRLRCASTPHCAISRLVPYYRSGGANASTLSRTVQPGLTNCYCLDSEQDSSGFRYSEKKGSVLPILALWLSIPPKTFVLELRLALDLSLASSVHSYHLPKIGQRSVLNVPRPAVQVWASPSRVMTDYQSTYTAYALARVHWLCALGLSTLSGVSRRLASTVLSMRPSRRPRVAGLVGTVTTTAHVSATTADVRRFCVQHPCPLNVSDTYRKPNTCKPEYMRASIRSALSSRVKRLAAPFSRLSVASVNWLWSRVAWNMPADIGNSGSRETTMIFHLYGWDGRACFCEPVHIDKATHFGSLRYPMVQPFNNRITYTTPRAEPYYVCGTDAIKWNATIVTAYGRRGLVMGARFSRSDAKFLLETTAVLTSSDACRTPVLSVRVFTAV